MFDRACITCQHQESKPQHAPARLRARLAYFHLALHLPSAHHSQAARPAPRRAACPARHPSTAPASDMGAEHSLDKHGHAASSARTASTTTRKAASRAPRHSATHASATAADTAAVPAAVLPELGGTVPNAVASLPSELEDFLRAKHAEFRDALAERDALRVDVAARDVAARSITRACCDVLAARTVGKEEVVAWRSIAVAATALIGGAATRDKGACEDKTAEEDSLHGKSNRDGSREEKSDEEGLRNGMGGTDGAAHNKQGGEADALGKETQEAACNANS